MKSGIIRVKTEGMYDGVINCMTIDMIKMGKEKIDGWSWINI